MNNHGDDVYPDEPPPSYEEATGSTTSIPPPLPPRLPPRNPTTTSTTTSTTTTSHGRAASYNAANSNNPFFNTTNNKQNHDANNLTIPQQQHHRRHASAGAPSSPLSPAGGPAQTFAQLLPASQLGQARQFPPSVNLYRDAFPGALQRRYFLGEHQATPLYAVAAWLSSDSATTNQHPSTRLFPQQQQASTLVLHNGPSEDYAPLATASYDNAWAGRRTMHVLLPPLPHQDHAEPITVQTGTTSMSLGSGGIVGGGGLSFSFAVEIPWPASASNPSGNNITWHKEAYEWRRSKTHAVAGLGGASHGWKLVRLSDALPPGGLAVAGSGPPSGDGHEVVAVCANAGGLTMTKLFRFAFLGTGLSGVLGERWAVMAVVTGLVIWDRDSRRDALR